MNGYRPNYFDKNLLESMKNSLRQVVLGEAESRPVAQAAKKGYAGYGGLPIEKLSDLELQKRMQGTKRSSIFGGEQKQSDEYLAYEAEANRRKGAQAPSGDVAVPGLRGGLPQMADADIPGMVDRQTGAGYNTRMNDLPAANQEEIMRTTTTGPQAKRSGAAYSVRPERLPYEAEQEVLRASRTPAALNQADASIARATAAGINPNTPGVIPVRPSGGAPAPMPGTQGNKPAPTPIPVNPASLPADTRAELLRQIDNPRSRKFGTNVPPKQR